MDRDEIERLYDEWAPRLLGYIRSITRDRALAEDALHELFVKLARRRPRLLQPAAYLYRAAHNEALRVGRGRVGGASLAELEVVAPTGDGQTAADAAELAGALDRLPIEQARVVLLHALEGLTFREVAEVLGIPANTAASRYRYALARLREVLV